MTLIATTLSLLADVPPASNSTGAAPQGPGSLLTSPMFPIFILLIVFMLWTMNSKRKQEKEKQAQLSAMKRGDRVQTIGGILGTIVEVRDNGEIVVKVDESNNTKIKFAKSAVSRVVSDDDKEEKK